MGNPSEKTILVIEDDESLREAVIAALRKHGYKVLHAPDGQEGLAIALQTHPDLILLDELMPAMTGLSMLETLRMDDWGLSARVIMMSNINETKMVNQALVQNVKHYVVKSDISLESLIETVDKALNITTSLPPNNANSASIEPVTT